MEQTAPRVAVVSIGDEVLRGDTVDTNMAFLFAELYQRGARPQLGLTIPDELPVIVARLRELAGQYDWVLTGGGIGPTPDDKTRQAVAEAFGLPLEMNAHALAEYQRRRGTPLNPGQAEMCRLPAGCELIWGEGTQAPAFRVANVYVLPGVPQVLRAMWGAIAERFHGPAVHVARFSARSGESHWADVMEQFVARYPQLEFGSYPRIEGGWYSELTVRGHDAALVERVAKEFHRAIESRSDVPG
jgi:molybdenum cofactor synthesis domain-containing protein